MIQTEELTHPYRGFDIPVRLIEKTGGAVKNWEGVIKNHFRAYDRLISLRPGMSVVEIGCGVGRDAIPLHERIGDSGTYLGIDVIEDSISWCKNNITARWPGFTFNHFDVWSQGYNPDGKLRTEDVAIARDDGSVDIFILQSVFTHLFADAMVHYLAEMKRTLKASGQAFLTAFVVDEARLHHVQNREDSNLRQSKLKFKSRLADGLYTNNVNYPEVAVAVPMDVLESMLNKTGMRLARPVDFGYWAADRSSHHAQDILVLEPVDE